MDLKVEDRLHVLTIASEALAQLKDIASAALGKLHAKVAPRHSALASINTLNDSPALANLAGINRAAQESYLVLASEPAIARITVIDEEDKEHTYYICRTAPIPGVPNLASYRAPVGRLAALGPGEELTLPNGKVMEVIERALLRPTASATGWDSLGTRLEFAHCGPITIESLRALTSESFNQEATVDLVGQLLAEEAISANIFDGARRSVITKMELRDQPVLDKYQDNIFRLPLDKRLLILGPPGAGKTTTLIRRLGQKLDLAFLEESERRLVVNLGRAQDVQHAESWLMFTPTELLKQYLKEAFAREGVPASDLRLKTWQDYRRELARNTFGVLKTATGGGPFVLKDGLSNLSGIALNSPIPWFEEFNTWQRSVYARELHDATTLLVDAKLPEAQALGIAIRRALSQGDGGALAATFESLAAAASNVQALINSLKESSDAKIKAALNLQLNRNRSFLDELARFIDQQQQADAQTVEVDEIDELDGEDDDDANVARTGRIAALNAYMQAVRAQARAAATKRAVSKSSVNGRILEWLADRGLAGADCADVGASLQIQTSARRFVNPVKRYLDGIPNRYRAFRGERRQLRRWYKTESFDARDIHPLELDIVLLAILRGAGDLLSRTNIQRDINDPAWSSLRPILGMYRNQILVDEATDFSPIQLACMAALAQPRLRSFFACGDFNQRLTTWGTRSADDLKWVYSDIDTKEITVSYRQSKQLNDLAHAMIRATGGREHNVSLPAGIDSNGVPPALLERGGDIALVVGWLAARICEIERFVGQLPSTAIFVNFEDEVAPFAAALNAALAEHNIQVIACREGQSIGQESDVRVFDIQHIKGLEFEAAFFVGIDQLAALRPELFDKYLYVGMTRAATYLGVTCEGELPAPIVSLRPHFGNDWQTQGLPQLLTEH
jgi:hypothetical protein